MFNEVDEDGDDCVTRALGGWQRGLEAGQPQLSRSSLAPPPHELLALPPSCRPTGLQQQRTCRVVPALACPLRRCLMSVLGLLLVRGDCFVTCVPGKGQAFPWFP